MTTKNTIVYLVSCYPAVSHTFIQQEIAILQRFGTSVAVASINATNYEASNKDAAVAAEEKSTFYIKEQGALKAFAKSLSLLFRHPGRFFSALAYAWKYTRKTRRSIKYFFGYFAEASLFTDWFRQQNADQVHVHFGNVAASVALIAQKMHPFRLSLTIHGSDIFYDETLEGLALKVQAAHWVRCISYFTQSQTLRKLPFSQWNKVIIIRMGIQPNLFCPQHKASTQTVRIISIGRLLRAKGLAFLLQATSNLKRQGYRLIVELIGDGPDREELQKIDNSTLFHGALSHPETLNRLRAADIFVLPSFAEGIPVVLMEAMAFEIPCIATQINGIPELIRDGIDGILVYPSDLHGLEKAIARLIDQPLLAQRLAASGKQRVSQLYDLERNTRVLNEIFKQGGVPHEKSYHMDVLPDGISRDAVAVGTDAPTR